MTEYNLSDEAATARLKQFDSEDPADLRRELALCRLLLEEASSKKNHGLSVSLLSVIGRLAAEFAKQQARRSLALHRDAVLRIASQLGALLSETLQRSGIPDWEEHLDTFSGRAQLLIAETRNNKSELHELIGRQR